MAMSQGEYIRRKQEEAKKYVSRAKVRDASEITFMNAARASKTVVPQRVIDKQNVGNDCATTVVIQGKGTNMEYLSILQRAQACAVCSDVDPVVNPGMYVPTPCFDRSKPPFAQQDLSGELYIPACTPGFNQYIYPATFNRTNCPT